MSLFAGLVVLTALSFVRGATLIQFAVLGGLGIMLLFTGRDPEHVALMIGVPVIVALAFYLPLCGLVRLFTRQQTYGNVFTRLRLIYFLVFDLFFVFLTFNLSSLVPTLHGKE